MVPVSTFRRLAVWGTPIAVLAIVALAVRNYRAAEEALIERYADRQLALARTVAVGVGAELAGHAASLAHLGALPSVQALSLDFLPARLREFFSSPHLTGVQEVLRVDASRRLWRWRPDGTRIAPFPEAWDDEAVWQWSQNPANRGVARTWVRQGPGRTRLLLTLPVYETAASDVVRAPSGRQAGLIALALDPGTLAVGYVWPVLTALPTARIELLDATGTVVYAEGSAPESVGARVGGVTAAASGDGVGLITTTTGLAVESRASLSRTGRPLQVRLVVPRWWIVADVRRWFASELALFLALIVTTLGAGWALLRVAQSEAKYRELLERAADGVFVLDRRGLVSDVNASGAALVGSPVASLVGKPFTDLVADDSRASWEAATGGLQAGARGAGSVVLRGAGGDGVRTDASVSREAGGHRLVLVRDARERERLDEQLRQAQKMEAVGRLAGGIAHDFNNLLTAIVGYNDLLIESLGDGDPRREDALQVRRAADRAADLTRQLLAVGRRQMLRPRVVDLNALVVRLEGLLTRMVGEHIALRSSLAPGLWAVEADPGQIEQVIINLVVNARDAMAGGGEVTIETANVTEALPAATVATGRVPVPGVRLSVVDTGSGMDKGTLARIFEPFFTTKPLGHGTGLGLPMAQGIVQQSRGELLITSAPGGGTRIDVVLPACMRAPVAPEERERDRRQVRAGVPASVLLVEDDAMVRRFTRQTLEGLGYDVREAATSDAALAWLEAADAPPDVLVTDVVMPGMNGAELAAAARRRWPGLPVLFVSGYSADTLGAHGVSSAAGRLLTKPFTAEALSVALSEALGRARAAGGATREEGTPGGPAGSAARGPQA